MKKDNFHNVIFDLTSAIHFVNGFKNTPNFWIPRRVIVRNGPIYSFLGGWGLLVGLLDIWGRLINARQLYP